MTGCDHNITIHIPIKNYNYESITINDIHEPNRLYPQPNFMPVDYLIPNQILPLQAINKSYGSLNNLVIN